MKRINLPAVVRLTTVRALIKSTDKRLDALTDTLEALARHAPQDAETAEVARRITEHLEGLEREALRLSWLAAGNKAAAQAEPWQAMKGGDDGA